eukprot:1109438-Amphidinium_carterae.2
MKILCALLNENLGARLLMLEELFSPPRACHLRFALLDLEDLRVQRLPTTHNAPTVAGPFLANEGGFHPVQKIVKFVLVLNDVLVCRQQRLRLKGVVAEQQQRWSLTRRLGQPMVACTLMQFWGSSQACCPTMSVLGSCGGLCASA